MWRKWSNTGRGGRLMFESLEPRLMLGARGGNGGPVISEFMAVNEGTLADEDGTFSDWIEVHNPTGSPVNLDGWHLTDSAGNLDKWRFPAVTLAPGEFLVVFASNKDRTEAGSQLHTNFQLSGSGEFLALSRPDLSIAHAFAPEFPEQFEDISYGLSQEVTLSPLIRPGTPARVLVPSDGSLGSTWTGSIEHEPFDDRSWLEGTTEVGYDTEEVSEPTNIAPTGTASQSSSYSGSFPASLAIDGNLANFTHTANEPDSYWRLALPETKHLGSIVLFNRASCCAGRLSNFRLSVFDAGMTEVFGQDFYTPAQGGGNVGLGESFSVDLPPGTWGQTVQVQLLGLNNDGNGYLSLAEVEVYESTGYHGLFGTDLLTQMEGVNASAYLRIPFAVADPAELELLHLKMRYDDAFVAYLNGREVARRGAPASPAWDSAALEDRPDAEALRAELINISEDLDALRAGENILAIQALNSAADDPDFLLTVELEGTAASSEDVHYFFPTPTPGTFNNAGLLGFVADTKFSVDRGFFAEPFSVQITTDTPGATIRYTTDGTPPTETEGTVYTGPIPVSTTTTLRAAAFRPEFGPTNVDTHSYIFLEDVIRQPADPPGLPRVWDGRAQNPIPADYEMDPEVVDNPAYRDEIVDGLSSIPTISIVMDPEDLFGPERGIYINSGQRGRQWEHPTSVEIINPDGSSFQVDSGIRIHGYSWRYHSNTPKHSFRLEFRDEYGPRKLEYPLFPDAPVERFDSIVLRAQGGRAWAGRQRPEESQYLRDTFARDTARDMGAIDGHATLVHLYLNGLYWGLYNPVERPDAQMGEEYFGGSEEDYDALNRRTSTNEAIDGDLVRYYEMLALADRMLAEAAGGQDTSATYAAIDEYLDIDDMIDFFLIHQYTTNRDGPETFQSNNQRAIGSRVGNAEFRFFVWDMEYSIWNATDNININVNVPTSISHVYTALRRNADFRLRYADHVQKHLFNGGALTPEVAAARWESRAESIYTAIIGESARWGDAKRATPYTRDLEWTAERNRLLTQYFPRRTGILIGQLRAAGLYPNVAAPSFNQYGGEVPPGFGLSISAPGGNIYYTLDGSDPRLPGGGIHGTLYTGPLTLRESVPVKARALDGTEWSALSAAEFQVSGLPIPRDLVITELNYNPYDPTAAEQAQGFTDNEDFELIELQNIGDAALDLTSVQFSEGVQFEFTGTHEGPPILITEAGTDAPDFIEIQNVSNRTIETSGWVVAANDASNSQISDVHPILWTLPASMAPGELLYRPDTAGDNIFWRTDGNGWVMIVDDQGRLGDFVVWGYSPAEIAALSVDINGFGQITLGDAWSGPAVPAQTVTFPPSSLQRTGNSDHDNASDWAFAEPQSGGDLNTGLAIPFPGIPPELDSGEFVLIARNAAAVRARYGTGINVAGQYTGKLSNGGERITLIGPAEQVILDFRYGDSNESGWPNRPDGRGSSLEIIDPQGDYDDPENWRSSSEYGGSPGRAGTGPLGDVVVNEVLTHTDFPVLDTIELHNTTGSEVDIGGWYLSDSSSSARKASMGWESDPNNGNYKRFRIPDGTIIPAGGYVVFDEQDFNFALDGAHGDDVWLMEADAAGKLIRFVDHVEFGAAAAGESWGRWPNGTGDLYPMISRTLDKERPENGENSGPRVGPLIFSEVQYNPSSPARKASIPPSPIEALRAEPDDLEFVEIYNPTARAVDLTDWRIRGEIDYDFPDGTMLAPYSAMVIVPFDPADAAKLTAFRTWYGLDASVELLGGYTDQLGDEGGRVKLQRPDETPADEPGYIPRLLEDEVRYDDQPPWPTEADGGGQSLGRTATDAWGNTHASWAAASPTPGSTDFVPLPPAEVVGRHIFYNDSAFDGNNPGADDRDDAAIAPDKVALLPGFPSGGDGNNAAPDGRATLANYTSYEKGINGIIVDISFPAEIEAPRAERDANLSAVDFEFRAGNSNDPTTWSLAPAPSSVTVRAGEGVGGSDRTTLIWPQNAIQNQWLQVTVLPTANTGLREPDIFYFGNAIGESGNSTTDAKVNVFDMLGTRDNPRTFLDPAPIDFFADFNRDQRVNAYDMLIARDHQTNFLNALKLISVPQTKSGQGSASIAGVSAHDAVLAEAATAQSEGQSTSFPKLDWLYEFEQMRTHRQPEKKDSSTKLAIDQSLPSLPP